MRAYLRGRYIDEPLRRSPVDAANNHIRCFECGGWIDVSDLVVGDRSCGAAATSSYRPNAVSIGNMKTKPQTLIYTILADDQPIVAIEATGTEARELCKEDWFREELSLMKWKGEPLYNLGIQLRARPATRKSGQGTTKQAGKLENLKKFCSFI
jgi:hypothetical protein